MSTMSMSHITVMTIIILALCFAIVIFNYLHKKHIRYNVDDLKKTIEKIFEDADATTISKKHFIIRMKNKYTCSGKDAMYLIGKARENHLITIENDQVKLEK